MNQDYRMSSAVNVLEYDELLIEILLRLPQKSLIKCKCVSWRWNDTISGSYFRHRYVSKMKSSSLPLLGFFRGTILLGSQYSKKDWVPPFYFLSTCEEGNPIRSHNFIKKVGSYVGGSSDGLIICCFHPNIYYVCNPITNQFLKLPKSSFNGRGYAIGLCTEGCSDDEVIHFKVVVVCDHDHNLIEIETFSSRTGKWVKSKLTCPSKILPFPYKICHVTEGVFYWKALEKGEIDFIIAYDSNTGNNHLRLIRLPNDIWPGVLAFVISRDGLLQCAFFNREGFTICVLKKKISDYGFSDIVKSNEWILRQQVQFNDLSIKCLQNMNLADLGDNHCPPGFPSFPHLIAFHPQDSRLLYFQLGYMIFCYNIETRGVQLLEYQGKAHPSNLYEFYPFVQGAWPGSLPCIGTRHSRASSSFIKRGKSIRTGSIIPNFEGHQRRPEKKQIWVRKIK